MFSTKMLSERGMHLKNQGTIRIITQIYDLIGTKTNFLCQFKFKSIIFAVLVV